MNDEGVIDNVYGLRFYVYVTIPGKLLVCQFLQSPMFLQECYAQNYTTESGYDYQDLGCISTQVGYSVTRISRSIPGVRISRKNLTE